MFYSHTNVHTHTHTHTVPSKFLLYGRIINDNLSQIAMASLETDMGVSVPLPFQIPGPGTHYVAYDIRSRKVYWDETNPPAIKSAPIDASSPPEPEVVIGTDIRDVSGQRSNFNPVMTEV